MNWPNRHERAITLEPGTINQAPNARTISVVARPRWRPRAGAPEMEHNTGAVRMRSDARPMSRGQSVSAH